MNLAIIALLPRAFNLCEISMSSGLTGTSSASAILKIASSGKLYALSGIPWNSREFFLVYCSKRSRRSESSDSSSSCSFIRFLAPASSFSVAANSVLD